MCAVGMTFYVTRGFGSVVETFAMSFVAVVASHASVVLVRFVDQPRAVRPSASFAILSAAAVLATICGAGWLLRSTRNVEPIAYRSVTELMADPSRWLGDEVKLRGNIESGSLLRRVEAEGSTYLFVLATPGQRVSVRFSGAVPDTFKERTEVLARGRLTRDTDGSYVFVASEVSAKCPSTYQTADGPVPASKFR